MSWLYSQALVAAFLEGTSSDGAPSAPSSGRPTPQAYSSSDRTTDFSRLSRFGMTFAPLTDSLGADVLTWFLEGSPVRPIPPRLRAATLLTTSGRKCSGWWQMSLPGTSLPRTSSAERSTAPQTTSSRWATRSSAFHSPRRTWVQTTFGPDIGYLHTPTCTANYSAPSMQKHACARAFVRVFGPPSPLAHEWLMGWPLGWTDLSPAVTVKSRCALPSRSLSCPAPSPEALSLT